MKITLTMDLTAENLNKLRLLLPDEQIPEQPTMFDSPYETAVEPTADSSPAAETVPVDKTPAKTETPTEEQNITETDVRAVAMKLSKAGKQAELAAIFAKFGCKKLSDFKKCPENYPALMKELVSANG